MCSSRCVEPHTLTLESVLYMERCHRLLVIVTRHAGSSFFLNKCHRPGRFIACTCACHRHNIVHSCPLHRDSAHSRLSHRHLALSCLPGHLARSPLTS